MPLQNRVTPLGELVAEPARGLVYGNRGCLHDAAGRIRRHYGVRRWISCRLEFKGWQRSRLLQPGKFTELFFLDEATALAAGHARALSAGVRTTTGSLRGGRRSIPPTSVPTRSTRVSTRSASTPTCGSAASTPLR